MSGNLRSSGERQESVIDSLYEVETWKDGIEQNPT